MLIFCNQKAEPIKKPLNHYLDDLKNVFYVIRAKNQYKKSRPLPDMYVCLRGD